MLDLLVEIVELQKRRNTYLNTSRTAVVDHCKVQSVPIALLN